MAVFFKKLRSCTVKVAAPATCQKACARSVVGIRKANNATAARRGQMPKAKPRPATYLGEARIGIQPRADSRSPDRERTNTGQTRADCV